MPVRFRFPKSWWLRIPLGLLALLLFLLLVNEFAIWATGRDVDRQLQLSRDAGLPTNAEELLGPAVPDVRNAAIPFGRAAASAETIWNALSRKFEEAAFDPVGVRPAGFDSAFDAELARHPRYEPDLVLADSLPDYRSIYQPKMPSFGAFLSNVRSFRDVLRIESERARRLSAAGRRDEAAKLLLRLLRMTKKSMFKEPFGVSALGFVATRRAVFEEWNDILRSGALSAPIHDAIEAACIDELELRAAMVKALGDETLLGFEMYDEKDPWYTQGRLPSAWRNHDLSVFLRLNRKLHAATAEGEFPDSDISSELLRELRIRSGWRRVLAPWTANAFPMQMQSYQLCLSTLDRHNASARCLRIVNAAVRKGLAKPSIKDLGLPPEAIVDPYDDEPLRILHRPAGFIVYSIGENCRDDGGDIHGRGLPDIGFGPTSFKLEHQRKESEERKERQR